MAEISLGAQELNELRWWSHWGKVHMLDDSSYVIRSPAFPEPLFNHASILSVGAKQSDSAIRKALALFKEARIEPSFFVVDDQRFFGARLSLESAGFSAMDTLEVMRAASRWQKSASSVEIVTVRGDTRRWVDAYVRSFYAGDAPMSDIQASVGKAAKDKDASFVLAMRGKEVVGEMALYQTGGLLGAYCVGTVPEHRRSGVASGMLSYARRLAAERQAGLILQTFASDRVIGFYVDQGFQRLYRKLVLSSSGSA